MNVLKNVLSQTGRMHLGQFIRNSTEYTSAISLKNIYPNSNLRLTTIRNIPNSSNGAFNGYIPLDQLNVTYSKSSGPGGQNVNKINTKVDVRFHLSSATWLSDEIKQTLLEKCKNEITKEGFLVFRSDLTRYQHMNLADCLEKIRTLIRNALKKPEPVSAETLDRIRKRNEKAVQLRLAMKRERSQIKAERKPPVVL